MTATQAPMIVHVVYRFAVGGLENGLVNLINGLPMGSWRHAIVSLTDVDERFAARLARTDVELLTLHKRAGHAVPLYPKLFRAFRRLRPSIVHTRNLAALEATVPAWAARVPVRIHGEHGRDMGDLRGTDGRRRRVRRLFSPFVTRYVTVSPDLKDYLSEYVGIASHRIEQIFNGVDTRRFAPRGEVRSPIPGCPFDGPACVLIGSVGRMDPVKDHPTLARAFVALRRRRPDLCSRLRLILVGEGATRLEVESILNDGGARSFAWLAGERHDIADVMRGLDCFVLPSLAEGVSNTILEAMASALPVIATRVGANADLVSDGVSGRLVAADNPALLARAIEAYAVDPELRRRHGNSGREVAENTFSLDAMIRRYDQMYASLVHGRKVQSGSPMRIRSSRVDA